MVAGDIVAGDIVAGAMVAGGKITDGLSDFVAKFSDSSSSRSMGTGNISLGETRDFTKTKAKGTVAIET